VAVDSVKQTASPLEFFINNSNPSLQMTSAGSISLICLSGDWNSFGAIPKSNGKNRLCALGAVIFT
jgi:hypothetical protein